MGIVTAVRRNVKNPSRCSVFVDDEFLAACPIDVALSLGIRKGIELTTDLEHQLRREDKRIVMRQKAHRFATYKPRTEHQVRAFLATKELTPEEVDDVMSWIVEFRLIDDAAYVERFLAAAFERKPLSRLMARRTLLKKGIPDALLAPALERWYSQEATEDVAYRAAVKKLRMLSTASPSEKESKLIRFLQYRAYSWSTVKQIVERLKTEGLLVVLIVLACCSLPAVAQPDTCGRMRLPDAINSFQPTTMPVLDAFGTLYVDRKLHPDNRDGGVRDPDDVWVAKRRDGQTFSELAQSPISTDIQPDVIFWVSADGLDALAVGPYAPAGSVSRSLVLLARKTPQSRFDSVRIIRIPDVVDLGRNFYASMTEDRSIIILALERAEGRGGLDLYVSRFCEGAWSRPLHMGPTVNTPAFDGAPWLSADGRTLYFASSGREDRLGKADLYVTHRLDSTWTRWSAPQNLGGCINSIEDETAISLLPTGDSALIHSWDPESGRPGIYLVSLPASVRPEPTMTVACRVVDAITRVPVPNARLDVQTHACHAWTVRYDSAHATFTTVLPQRCTATLRASAAFMTSSSSVFRLQTLDSISTTSLTISLFNQAEPIASLYFDRGSSVPSQADRDTLQRIVNLVRGRGVELHAIGYTDRIGSDAANRELSRQRASAVADALAALGLDASLIESVGRGVAKNSSKLRNEEHPQSRRVDIYVRTQSRGE